MSARDLVGRPLVPFFDAQDNVNEALQLDAQAHEQLDVDARVWDKELGYFVYPTESQSLPQQSQSQSQAIPMPNRKTPAVSDAQLGKLLLTPDMLSRSAPSATGSGMQHLHNTMGMTHAVVHQTEPERDARGEVAARSASAKRETRQKKRSNTPNRSRQRNGEQPQPTSDGPSDEDHTASDGSDKSRSKRNNGRNKNHANTATNGGDVGGAAGNKKTRNKTPQKSKDELSANGKWAWSAFQSSPDPKSLPLPPFAAGSGASPGMGAMPPPFDPPKIEERLDPPPPPLYPERPPSAPPDMRATPHPASIEHSMTQDLRRMLNIGS